MVKWVDYCVGSRPRIRYVIMDTITGMGTVTFTNHGLRASPSKATNISTWSADTLNATLCGRTSSHRRRIGLTVRFTAGANVQNRCRSFFLSGRFLACVIGSVGSTPRLLKRNSTRCEHPLTVVGLLAMKPGPTRSQSDTDCGTRCGPSDALARSSRHNHDRKFHCILPPSPFPCVTSSLSTFSLS